MWDEPTPPEEQPQPFPELEPQGQEEPVEEVAWTDGQLMRVEQEFRKAQRAFAYHPVVGLKPLRGDPPHEYEITYRVRTLALNDAGELEFLDEAAMHIWLPPGFPNQGPVVRPMANVFHPNITAEGVCWSRTWQPADSLVDLIAQVGELLVYRTCDPECVVNPVAWDWMNQNGDTLPLDSHADFSQYNGGEPLGRIQRLGPGTLDQIRRALDNMRYALVSEDNAPTPEEVAEFAKQTRAAVNLFLDSEVPDALRQQASECDDWCRELPASVPLWDYLRTQRTRASQAEAAATSLRQASAAFEAGLKSLEAMVSPDAAKSPANAVKVIPSTHALQGPQLKLPPLARDFEKWMQASRDLVEAMKETAPEVPIAPDGSLGRRLTTQGENVRETVATATRTAQQAIADTDAIFRRVAPEMAAMAQVVGWREFMDLFAKARNLEKQVTDWGSAGVQAFFLTNASGMFGPFQLEEPVELGSDRIVVRSTARGQMDLINATGQELLGRSNTGMISTILGRSEGNPGYQAAFQLTDRCEDLLVQLNFIQQQTVEALSQLQRPVSGATSWCGAISELLADARQQQNLRDSHRKAAHRWKALMTDLAALSRFKERLATYHLVQRMSEEVARVRDLIAKAHTRHKDSTEKIAAIMSKCTRDMATDQLLVPPKFAKSYAEELKIRDDAKHETAKMQSLLKQIAREIAARTGSSRLCGRPEWPEFRILAALPEGIAALYDALSDAALSEKLDELNKQLNVTLPFKPPAAPASAPVSRSAQPDSAGAPARPTAPAIPPPEPPVATSEAQENDASAFADEPEQDSELHVMEEGEEPKEDEQIVEGF